MTAKRCLLSFTCAIVLAGLVGVAAQSTPAEDETKPTEDNVLERFLGDWQTRTQIRHSGPPAREFNTIGKAVCTRTLGGTFFEFRSESIPAGESDLQVMTYDRSAKVFQQWVFSSDGYTHTADGTWNPQTATLAWKGKSGDASFVIEDRWVSPDQLDWTLRRTDGDGRVLQTISGTLKRDRSKR